MAYSKVPMNHTAEHKLRVQLEAKLKESEEKVEGLEKKLNFLRNKSIYTYPSYGYHNGKHSIHISPESSILTPKDFDEALKLVMEDNNER